MEHPAVEGSHLSDDDTVAKMGHPRLYDSTAMDGVAGCGQRRWIFSGER
jgi:hypothetical protein